MSNHQSKDLPSAAPAVSQNTYVKITGNNQTVRTTLKGMSNGEHEKIYSRTLAKDVEIGVGIHGTSPDADARGGLVPKNPFASKQQQKYMYANPSILGKKGLAEWSSKTDFKSLPKKVKK
jgi:hypothetical protein